MQGPSAPAIALVFHCYNCARHLEAALASIVALLTIPLLPIVLVWRRIHGANARQRHRQQRGDHARCIKSTLDLRRAPRSAAEAGQ